MTGKGQFSFQSHGLSSSLKMSPYETQSPFLSAPLSPDSSHYSFLVLFPGNVLDLGYHFYWTFTMDFPISSTNFTSCHCHSGNSVLSRNNISSMIYSSFSKLFMQFSRQEYWLNWTDDLNKHTIWLPYVSIFNCSVSQSVSQFSRSVMSNSLQPHDLQLPWWLRG